MASFVVMEAPYESVGDRPAEYVRDGFHFFAFLVAPLWLVWHRLWIEALVAVALMLGLSALGTLPEFGAAASVLSLLLAIGVGLEGPALRIATLRRRGWREWGVVDAENRAEAEIRHLAAMAEYAEAETEFAPPASTPAPAHLRPAPAGPALGLFSYPGRS